MSTNGLGLSPFPNLPAGTFVEGSPFVSFTLNASFARYFSGPQGVVISAKITTNELDNGQVYASKANLRDGKEVYYYLSREAPAVHSAELLLLGGLHFSANSGGSVPTSRSITTLHSVRGVKNRNYLPSNLSDSLIVNPSCEDI